MSILSRISQMLSPPPPAPIKSDSKEKLHPFSSLDSYAPKTRFVAKTPPKTEETQSNLTLFAQGAKFLAKEAFGIFIGLPLTIAVAATIVTIDISLRCLTGNIISPWRTCARYLAQKVLFRGASAKPQEIQNGFETLKKTASDKKLTITPFKADSKGNFTVDDKTFDKDHHGVLFKPHPNAPIVFLFSGNANCYQTNDQITIFQNLGYSVAVCNYPGYVGCPGEKTVEQFKKHIQGFYTAVQKEINPNAKILIYGHSLGGSAALITANHLLKTDTKRDFNCVLDRTFKNSGDMSKMTLTSFKQSFYIPGISEIVTKIFSWLLPLGDVDTLLDNYAMLSETGYYSHKTRQQTQIHKRFKFLISPEDGFFSSFNGNESLEFNIEDKKSGSKIEDSTIVLDIADRSMGTQCQDPKVIKKMLPVWAHLDPYILFKNDKFRRWLEEHSRYPLG